MSERFRVKKMPPTRSINGIVLMHKEKMRDLNLVPRDVVKISAKRDAVAKVEMFEHDNDMSKNYLLMDGEIRHTIGANIEDKVNLEPVEDTKVKDAKEIVFTSSSNREIGNDILKNMGNLEGRVLTKGQIVRFNMPTTNYDLLVSDTDPNGVVEVKGTTRIQNVRKPQSGKEQIGGELQESDPTKSDESLEKIPDITYEDVGGLDDELEKIREMVELPLNHPELFDQLGIDSPKGVLLNGPPGTGKTLMAKAVANEVNASFHVVSGPEIMSKFYGESEEKLREIFEEAEENSPAIIFIDELDSIAPSRGEVEGEVGKRVVAQLLSLMDGLEERGNVTVLAATNRVDAVDNALRRGGRFDREIEISVPNKEERLEILNIHTRGMPIDKEIDLEDVARRTHGFVGADIENLCKESAMNALRRLRPEIEIDEEEIDPEELSKISIKPKDFNSSLKDIEPSAMREVFVEVPETNYSDVGGLTEEKEKLVESVEWPLDYGDVFSHFDTEAPKGILLYGPPGNGKTLLAKAVANASESNFISVKGPELMNKYVGESEKGIREIFKKARQNSPTVIFFDEIDSIANERGSSNDNEVSERMVSQLLTELDGLEELSDVVVIAATNRPDIIDSALIRTGRLEKTIEVDLPNQKERKDIIDIHTKNMPIEEDVDIEEISELTEGFTGSDIEALCREAAMIKMRRLIKENNDIKKEKLRESKVSNKDFDKALENVSKSLKEEEIEMYNKISERVSEIDDQDVETSQTRSFQ